MCDSALHRVSIKVSCTFTEIAYSSQVFVIGEGNSSSPNDERLGTRLEPKVPNFK